MRLVAEENAECPVTCSPTTLASTGDEWCFSLGNGEGAGGAQGAVRVEEGGTGEGECSERDVDAL